MVICKLRSVLFCITTSFTLFTTVIPDSVKSVKSDKKKSAVATSSKMVDFKYDQANLKDILNDFAEFRGINIIYPETDQLTSKITFDAGKKITRIEAWDFLTMMLDQAGFSLIQRNGHTYELVENKNAYRSILPLYMNVDYHLLPDSQEKVRYIYYCNSIQIAKQASEITTILTNIVGAKPLMVSTSFSGAGGEDKVLLDNNFNAIIFTMRSEIIKEAMNIISVFDEPGVRETVEIVPLKYAVASEVTTILTNMIGGSTTTKPSGFVSLTSSASNARYFSEYASVLNLDPKGVRKLNSLVIIGRNTDVEHIKNFIQKYLDIPQQQGKSFFHVIELEWIKSSDMLTALNALKGQGSASGQSVSSIDAALAFDPQIQIIAETPAAPPAAPTPANGVQGANSPTPTVTANTGLRGGNRIVIASSERDWARIESLIKQVDIPRRQVIVEALIVDLELSFIRRLATQLRTRGLTPSIFPRYMQAQAGLVLNNIIYTDGQNNNYLTGDLSQILSGATTQPVGGFTPPGVSTSNNGQVSWNQTFGGNGEDQSGITPITANPALNSSTVFMVSNSNPSETNGVWAFFQLLSTHKSAKILTRPVILAANNQQASVTSGVVKNLAGGVTGSNSPTVNYSYLPANISVSFVPIISANNIVNLQLGINLVLWQNPANENDGTQIQRVLNTNISVKSGDIIVLGGLIKETVTRSKISIPGLDKIPVVSSFTANRYKNTTRDQLFVLLRTTVVAPRTEGGMGEVSKHAANYTIQQFEDFEDAFSSLKDPITRWFFNEDADRASEQVNDKLQDLTETGRPSVEKNELAQIQNFLKPTYETNPLGVKWFSDSVHDKNNQQITPENKQMEELGKKLKNTISPFAGSRTVI